MKNLLKVVFLLVVSSNIALASQTVEFTKRARNEVREGPGNFYPLLMVFPAGVKIPVVERIGGWTKFSLPTEVYKQLAQSQHISEFAWLSNNCLQDKIPKQSIESLAKIAISPAVSPSARAAAIRGFAIRYGGTAENEIIDLERVKEVEFSPDEYFSFKRESQLIQDDSIKQRYSKYLQTSYVTTEVEQGIGLGIASRIAATYGIVEDQRILKYLNMLATYLLESSGAYDHQFKIYLLSSPEINAHSVIDGYIFFTEGMIRACDNEAELASVIAHELMHVILKHGLKEMGHRKESILADIELAELDEEIEAEDFEESRELEEYAILAYESASKPKHRLLTYENEADAGACLLLAASGYDPHSIIQVIQRIRDVIQSQSELEDLEANPFAYVDFEKRLDFVNGFLNTSISNIQGRTNRSRFLEYFKGEEQVLEKEEVPTTKKPKDKREAIEQKGKKKKHDDFVKDEILQSKYPFKDGYPVWLYNPAYEGNLGAVGIAKPQTRGGYEAQKRLALTIAQAELTRQINVLVDGELYTEKTVISKSGDEYYRSKLSSLSIQQTQQLIKNAVIKDEWIDPKTGDLYLWVVIER